MLCIKMAVEASRATNLRGALKRSNPVTKRAAGKRAVTLRSVFGEIGNVPDSRTDKAAAEEGTLAKKGGRSKAVGVRNGERKDVQLEDKTEKTSGVKIRQTTPAAKEAKRLLRRRKLAEVKPEPVEEACTAEETTETIDSVVPEVTTTAQVEIETETETCAAADAADADAATTTAELAQDSSADRKDINTPTDIYQCPYETPEIMAYLSELETRFRLKSDYMTRGDVKPHMRALLVDWMIRVQEHYKMSHLTLQQSVTFLDQVLSRRTVKTSHLQLVGITCLYIAAKYSERFPPEVRDLCRLTEDTYTAAQVLRMEKVILTTLQFELFAPEPTVFLDRLLQASSEDAPEHNKIANGSRYFLDLMLTELDFVRLLPSMRAAVSLNLARQMVLGEEHGWSMDLVFYHGYTESCLEKMVNRLSILLESTHKDSRYQAAYEKYVRSKYGKISQVFKYL